MVTIGDSRASNQKKNFYYCFRGLKVVCILVGDTLYRVVVVLVSPIMESLIFLTSLFYT